MNENPRSSKIQRQTAPETILIIDDDNDLRTLLGAYLKNNYNIIYSSDGPEGIEKARAHQPAVIVCDWMMPDMDGLEVCRQIKIDPELKSCYFILLTALGDTDERVFALETGADDFIQKPPILREFQARIRAGVRIYRLNRELKEKQKVIENDLARSRNYILSQLPAPFSSIVNGYHLEVDWYYNPSAQLGGDIFNYQWLSEKRLAIYLLDVAGHGIGAALLSVSVMHMLRTMNTDSPSKVLTLLNHAFPMEQQNNLFFTIWFGIIDFEKKTILYSCAGHPPALLLLDNAKQCISLKTTGLPIGMDTKNEAEETEIEFDAPFTLSLYSDGIYERTSFPEEDDPDFLEDWIQRVSNQPSNKAPVDIRKNMDWLVESAFAANRRIKFEDDVTLVQISIRPDDRGTN